MSDDRAALGRATLAELLVLGSGLVAIWALLRATLVEAHPAVLLGALVAGLALVRLIAAAVYAAVLRRHGRPDSTLLTDARLQAELHAAGAHIHVLECGPRHLRGMVQPLVSRPFFAVSTHTLAQAAPGDLAQSIAHDLGHVRHHHAAASLLVWIAGSFVTVTVIAMLATWLSPGLGGAVPAGLLLVMMLALVIVPRLLQELAAPWLERSASRFAAACGWPAASLPPDGLTSICASGACVRSRPLKGATP